MRRLAAVAAALALALAALPAAAAEPPQTPEMAGTDRACEAGRPDVARPADVVRMARLDDATGQPGPWYRSDARLDDAARSAASFPGGEFVTIVTSHGAVVFASLDKADGKTGATEIDVWCYFGGELIRTTVETFDPATERGWRRIRYYANGETGTPAVDEISEKRAPGAGEIPLSKAPLDRLVVAAAATPADLPFAAAYAEAKAKTLPPLRPPH